MRVVTRLAQFNFRRARFRRRACGLPSPTRPSRVRTPWCRVLGPRLPAKQLEAVAPHCVAEGGQPARKPVRKRRILGGIANEQVIASRL